MYLKKDEILVCLCKSEFFTSLDLRSGYYYIKLSTEIGHKGAFTTIFLKYKFLRMSFGLAQGPVYFTILRQKVLVQFQDFVSFIWTTYW